MNDDADLLMLSGLKHFQFCRRRWALVHIEQLWNENALTLEGHYIHKTVHDAHFTEARGATLLSRGMPVRSEVLRVTGICDMVELYRDENGVSITGREGRWRLYPVEYKHGRPDPRGADELQLCAQAMCLEEMLVTTIPEGSIYYWQTRRRLRVELSAALREQVNASLSEMHRLFASGYTPKAKRTKACQNCSMSEYCQPKFLGRQSASEYVRRVLCDGGEE